MLKELIGHGMRVNALDVSPNSRFIVSAGRDTVLVWDIESGKKLWDLNGHNWGITSSVFHPDNRLIATCSWGDELVMFWDMQTGKLLKSLPGHWDALRSLAFSPDGKLLVSGANNGIILVWRIDYGPPD
jgi:WD40 repeat protein